MPTGPVTMPPMTDIEPIRSFIRQQFLFDKDAPLGDDQELFPGIVDSLGVMELADFVEQTYGVQIGEDELMADNFISLTAIAALVDRKQA
jgi:acyl carrier protein